MKVIGFCGLPGSGKSTALEAIKDLGKTITMGDVVRNEAEKRGLEITSHNLGEIAKGLREKGGQEIIARKCVEYIRSTNFQVVFIDGLRSIFEVQTFKEFWKFPVVAIDTPDDLRYKFLFNRGRNDDPKDKRELKERDDRESKFGIKKVIENAEYMIKNYSTIEDLQIKTREIVLKIIENY
ncbi:MAG: AAA family ATPase [Promethearchaeota archaeon]